MIQCLRVDYRLLHGQTALAWTQSLGADCILIANDALMRDDIQKATLKLAKPSGVKLVMKNIEDSIAAINSGVTDKYRLFILVKTIEDAWKLAEGVDRIRSVNVGGGAPKPDTRMLTKSVPVTKEEEGILKKMIEAGLEVEIRQVPGDNKVMVKDVL